MPGRVYSALNTGGTPYTTPADEQAMVNQKQAADWMVQQALMRQRAQEFQATIADKANDRTLARDVQGTYAQRSAGDQALEGLRGQYGLENTRLTGANQLGYATAINQPRNREIDMAERQYTDSAPLRDTAIKKAGITNRFIDMAANALPSGSPQAPGSAPASSPFSPEDLRAFARNAVGLPEDPTDNLVKKILLTRATDPNADAADLPGLLAAAKSGDMSKLPAQQGYNRRTAQEYDTVKQTLATDVDGIKQFIAKNNYSIAGNIPELRQMYNGVLAKADSLRVSPETRKLIQNDLDQIIRTALSNTGSMFDTYGASAARSEFGLK